MIPESPSLVLLVPAVVGLRCWWVWFRNRSKYLGDSQSMRLHEGSLPDSFFDPRASDRPKGCKSPSLDAYAA